MSSLLRQEKDPSLLRIIIGILLVAGLAYGGYAGYQWLGGSFLGQRAEAAAPSVLDNARKELEAGRVAAARELVGPLLGRVEHPDLSAEAHLLMARVEQETGDLAAAREHLRTAAEDHPGNAYQTEAYLRYARLLEDTDHLEDARKAYERVVAIAPPEVHAPALTGLGRIEEQSGALAAARDQYARAAQAAEWHSAAWAEAIDALGDANVALAFSVAETPDADYYVVEKGDTITSIGMKLNTTQGLLLRANGIEDPGALHIGQRLKYTPKDFRIVIERSTNLLYLIDKDGIFKVYDVGLGRPGHETTPGKYKIGTKQKDPAWYPPSGGMIPPGDPENELGTRWMPLVPDRQGLPDDLGIHGTIAPETVGINSSSGCARLLNEEVEELYDLVVRSTPVEIVDVYAP